MSGSVKDFIINVLGDTSNADKRFDAFGKKTKKTFDGVFTNVGRGATHFDGFAGNAKRALRGVGVAFAAFGAAAVAFGVDSMKTAAEAQTQQAKLADAFDRFPALADTNVKALGQLNSQLAKKTKFDDDATASGQAVLAGFKLTGAQIIKLTPLLQDYAEKTGQDIPSAAQDLGKAIIGQGKALKGIGIQFTDLHDPTANFTQLVDGLTQKVGGLAEKAGTTAAGKLEILRNQFGEIQEAVGGPLIDALGDAATALGPTLIGAAESFGTWWDTDGKAGLKNVADFINDPLIPAFSAFSGWVEKNKDVLLLAGGAIGGLVLGYKAWIFQQWLLNAAMTANPVGVTVVAIGALVAVTALAITHQKELIDFMASALVGGAQFGLGIVRNFTTGLSGMVNGAVSAINAILTPANVVMRALGLPAIGLGKVNFSSGIDALSARLSGLQASVFAANGAPTGGGGGRALKMADGAVVRAGYGGVFAHIGEGLHDEAVLPLTPDVMSQLGGGGRSSATPQHTTVFEFHGEAGALMKLMTVFERQADGQRVMVSKMGKQ